MSDLFDLDFSHLAISGLLQTVIYSIPIIENSSLVPCVVAYTALMVTRTTKLFCFFIHPLHLGIFVGSRCPSSTAYEGQKTRTAASLFTLFFPKCLCVFEALPWCFPLYIKNSHNSLRRENRKSPKKRLRTRRFLLVWGYIFRFGYP